MADSDPADHQLASPISPRLIPHSEWTRGGMGDAFGRCVEAIVRWLPHRLCSSRRRWSHCCFAIGFKDSRNGSLVQRSRGENDERPAGTGTTGGEDVGVEDLGGEEAMDCTVSGESWAWVCEPLPELGTGGKKASRVQPKLNIQSSEAARAPEHAPVAKPTQRVGAGRIDDEPRGTIGPAGAALANTASNDAVHGAGRTARNRLSMSVHCGSHGGEFDS
jgi:hypothetical protein